MIKARTKQITKSPTTLLILSNDSGESVVMHFIYNAYRHGFKVKIIAMQIGELHNNMGPDTKFIAL